MRWKSSVIQKHSHVDLWEPRVKLCEAVWRKDCPRRRSSQHKGPAVSACPVRSQKRRDSGVAAAQGPPATSVGGEF